LRILITGASGLLGSRLVKVAIDAGHDVYATYNSHPVVGRNTRFLDILDKEAVNKCFTEESPDVVIHTASLTDVDLCEEKPDLARYVNEIATQNIAQTCRQTGSFLVHLSTDYVFDGQRGHYGEGDAPNPINEYGRSKLAGERQVALQCQSYCIARTSVLFGWGRTHRHNFATWVHEKLSAGQRVNVVSAQYASPTLNTNLARMLIEVADRRINGILHLAGRTRISRYEFAVLLARKFGFNENLLTSVQAEVTQWKAKRPFDSSLNVSKAQEILDNKPPTLQEELNEFTKESPRGG
jgi:dTDP-4-dehydrorhamnose reductase